VKSNIISVFILIYKIMSQQEILEGNILIAEFYAEEKFFNHSIILHGFSEDSDLFFDSQLKFHSSWDWLIPIVNKIISVIGFRTIDECTDFEWKLFTCISDMKLTTPISITFYNCVQFIKWFNLQKKI